MSDPLPIESTNDGVLISVRVIPRASKTAVDGTHAGSIRIRLNAPPVEGAANTELIKFIADITGVRQRQVEIRSGLRSRSKKVFVRAVSRSEVVEAFRAVSGCEE